MLPNRKRRAKTKNMRSHLNFKLQRCLFALLALFWGGPALCQTAESEEMQAGKALYMKKCEVCHLIGRNLINPEKEILNSKVFETEAKFKEFLSVKHGAMPAFAKIANDPKQVKSLIEYLHHAKANPSEVLKHQPEAAKSDEKKTEKNNKSETKASPKDKR